MRTARRSRTQNSTTVKNSDSEDLPWYLKSSLNQRCRIFGRLLNLYTFAITYEVGGFQLATMLA
jgi:hypothetical protein